MKNYFLTLLLSVISIMTAVAGSWQPSGTLLAFPGADGYGKYVSGGRGGKVFYVTRTDDCSDASLVKGTLRWALNNDETTGPRIVLFATHGTIYLKSKLKMKYPNVSILGQTAPGGGVCLAGYPLYICQDNVIVRYVRFRAGDIPDESLTGLDIENAHGVILDHCSMTWSMEECLTAYDTDWTTVQWCIIGEGLYNSKNSKGARAYATQWGGEHSTMHHTLITNSHSRSPRFNGVRSKSDVKGQHDYQVESEFANNVVFNWGVTGAIYGGEYYDKIVEAPAWTATDKGYDKVYMINNYYRPGPSTFVNNKTERWFAAPSKDSGKDEATTYGQWYLSGNKFDTNSLNSSSVWTEANTAAANANNYSAVKGLPEACRIASLPAEGLSGLTYESADEAYKSVTQKAGASLPRYDEVDERLLQEAAGTVECKYVGATLKGVGEYGIIDSPDDIIISKKGEYVVDGVTYKNYPALGMETGDKYVADSDEDGMPDAYEDANGFDKNNAADAAQPAANGYTNLENFLNGVAAGTVAKSQYESSAEPFQYNVQAHTITFSLGTSAKPVGQLPKPIKDAEGVSITIPANTSLYLAGSTLWAWTDGQTKYSPGDSYVITKDVTLTPVFRENKENVTDRNANCTITWDFTKAGAPKLGEADGEIYVTQVHLAYTNVDVPLTVNATSLSLYGYEGAKCTTGGVETSSTVAAEGQMNMAIDKLSDVKWLRLEVPYRAKPSEKFHAPVLGEDGKSELLLTPGDAFTQKPSWLSAKYSDATRTCYAPEKDDRATTTNLQGCVLKCDDGSYMEMFVKGTERVRLFISGSASTLNILSVFAVPNDGSLVKEYLSTMLNKNVPTCLDIDLDKTKEYTLYCSAATASTQMLIGAVKLIADTSVPTSGDATIAFPLTSGDLGYALVTPDGSGVAEVTYTTETLTPSSGSKIGGTRFMPKTKIAAASPDQVVTFSYTPAEGLKVKPTAISLEADKEGTDGGNLRVTVQIGNGKETVLGDNITLNRDSRTSLSYTLDSATESSDVIVVRVYPYNVGNTKNFSLANVAISGTYSRASTPDAIIGIESGNDLHRPSVFKTVTGRSLRIHSATKQYDASGREIR